MHKISSDMKKLILFIAVSFFSLAAFSQNRFGIKAGADLYKLDGKAFKDQFSFGYLVGAFGEISLSDKFSVQPEVLFGQNTVDTSSSFSDIYNFQSLSKVKLTYIKIPLMLNYKINKAVYLQAGPQYSILMDQNLSLVNNGKAAFKSGAFTLLGGFQANISRLMIFGRYGIGLENLNDIDNKEKWKSQSVQIGLGYNF